MQLDAIRGQAQLARRHGAQVGGTMKAVARGEPADAAPAAAATIQCSETAQAELGQLRSVLYPGKPIEVTSR